MKRILFVDDEPNVLTGLRRMLRTFRKEWDMEFLPSGEQALEALNSAPCDVIISDMRMPGMDGVQLLTAVKKDYPNTVRIALSGHADMEMVLECIGATHQYLAKPCDADTVKATIDRACSLRDLLNDDELQTLVTEMGSLPSLPSLYSEIMQAISDGKPLTEIGEIVAKDVAMTAKVLKIVNSAFFGLSRHVESPAQAAAILGIDAVRSLVLTAKVFADFEVSGALDIEKLWDHSGRVGGLARKIAQLENQPRKVADFSQMAGMLHDIGKLVLASQFGGEYGRVAELQAQPDSEDWQCEQEVFGHSHNEVGAYLLGLWGLPNPIVEAAAFHHDPNKGAEQFSPLTAVYIANQVCEAMERGDDPSAAQFDMEYLGRMGVTPSEAWFESARELGG
ncbi:MAG: HDOD domain-containing protein [Gammaproteobacteria bacterium]|nr:HDOD domain-containing protein [Gammaproteobacteria bacterium]